jgi:hypothetical protein
MRASDDNAGQNVAADVAVTRSNEVRAVRLMRRRSSRRERNPAGGGFPPRSQLTTARVHLPRLA